MKKIILTLIFVISLINISKAQPQSDYESINVIYELINISESDMIGKFINAGFKFEKGQSENEMIFIDTNTLVRYIYDIDTNMVSLGLAVKFINKEYKNIKNYFETNFYYTISDIDAYNNKSFLYIINDDYAWLLIINKKDKLLATILMKKYNKSNNINSKQI